MPALTLLPLDKAGAARKAIKRLFKHIRQSYERCNVANAMEKYCSLKQISAAAEPLILKEANGDEADVSALFASPATKGAMDTSTQSGIKAHQPNSPDGTVLRSTASNTASSRKMTLTNSTEKQGTLTPGTGSAGRSSGNSDALVPSSTGTLAEEKPSPQSLHSGVQAEAGAEAIEESAAIPAAKVKKKTRRGTRAGAQAKARAARSASKSIPFRAAAPSSSSAAVGAHRGGTSWSQEIRANVERLARQHAEKPLITVGDKMVASILANARADAALQYLQTQSPFHSGLSATSPDACAHLHASAARSAPPAHAESEITYVSTATAHSKSADRKRKVVSISENFDPMGRPVSSAPSSQLALEREPMEVESRPHSGEFQYFCDSGTPASTSAPVARSTGSTGTGTSQLSGRGADVPRCPQRLLEDCSRNKKKKIKARFRSMFREYSSQTPAEGVVNSPILPDSTDSALRHHLNRPFLTEVGHLCVYVCAVIQ